MKVFYTFAFSFLLFISINTSGATAILFKSDFISAKLSQRGELNLVQGHLNHGGVKKINPEDTNVTEIEVHIANGVHVLKLREPILGDKIEFGPFAIDVAKAIVGEINHQ